MKSHAVLGIKNVTAAVHCCYGDTHLSKNSPGFFFCSISEHFTAAGKRTQSQHQPMLDHKGKKENHNKQDTVKWWSCEVLGPHF